MATTSFRMDEMIRESLREADAQGLCRFQVGKQSRPLTVKLDGHTYEFYASYERRMDGSGRMVVNFHRLPNEYTSK